MKIQGNIKRELPLFESIGETVSIYGCIHKIRKMSGFSFVILRTEKSLIQCITELNELPPEGSWIKAIGTVKEEKRAAEGFEVMLTGIEPLSVPAEPLPVTLSKKELGLALGTNLDNRIISLRHPAERAIFKVQEAILKVFRDFLQSEGFTEIKTPKIVAGNAEGGAEIFHLDYFDREASLAQSPQFYKEYMVGVFGKVFETGPVFRAEKYDTSRHINEYTSLDIEVGFIESFYEIMEIETALMKHIFSYVGSSCERELSLLGVTLPEIKEIPALTFKRAKEISAGKLPPTDIGENDLKPIEEKLLCEYSRREFGSDFVFITHYPTVKRPFYAMATPGNPSVTESFDLLYNGIEITTGGQRIHEYEMIITKLKSLGMNPSDFIPYTDLHKYGVPPHGGFGLGLERLTARMLGFENIKRACLFPRDINRLVP